MALLGGAAAAAAGADIAAVSTRGGADKLVREEVRAVVRRARGAAGEDLKVAFYRLVRALRRDLPVVRAGLKEIRTDTLANLRDVLDETQRVFTDLLRQAGAGVTDIGRS